MIDSIGRRGRASLGAAALAVIFACAALVEGSPRLDLGPRTLLLLEAALCGAVGGAATAGFFGWDGARGAVRALLGGALASATALALFGAGGSVWLKVEAGTAPMDAAKLVGAWAPGALAAAGLLHGIERAGLRAARLRRPRS